MNVAKPNVLRQFESLLDSDFSFAADADLRQEDHVECKVSQSWPTTPILPNLVEGQDQGTKYEEALRHFILHPPGSHPSVTIVGGIGCGKTSVIRYVLDGLATTPPTREQRRHPVHVYSADPLIIYANLIGDDDEHDDEHDKNDAGAKKRLDESIWRILSAATESAYNACLDKFDEPPLDHGDQMVAFWRWLTEEGVSSLHSGPLLPNALSKCGHSIRERDDVAIGAAREAFFDKATFQDRTSIFLLKVKYLLTKSRVQGHGRDYAMCYVIDNLDQRLVTRHRAVSDFAQMLHQATGGRTVIPVRPFTFSRSRYFTTLGTRIDHKAPDPFEVLRRRIQRFEHRLNGCPEVALILPHLKSLDKRLTEEKRNGRKHSLYSLISSTCGHSPRLMLTNVHNMLVSQLLRIAEKDEDVFGEASVMPGTLEEAYLCDRNRVLRTEFFENMLDVEKHSEPERRIVKVHVLHYLYYQTRGRLNESVRFDELEKTMTKLCGFDGELFKSALRSLGVKSRPLLWWFDAEGKAPCGNSQEPRSSDAVALTEIGRGYFRNALEDYAYLKECAYHAFPSSDRNEKYNRESWKRTTLGLLKGALDVARQLEAAVQAHSGQAGLELLRGDPPFPSVVAYLERVHEGLRGF